MKSEDTLSQQPADGPVPAVENENRSAKSPHPTRANTLALAIALALLPVQYVLLRFGEAHGTGDALGVILTMAQWAAVVFALGLNRARARPQKA